MLESEVRLKTDRLLTNSGWIIDPEDAHRDVYIENAIKSRLTQLAAEKLGNKKPDYTLCYQGRPIAVLEVKKRATTTLETALAQAKEYAYKINVDIVFAFNGQSFQSLHLPTNRPLYYNNILVSSFPTPKQLAKYLTQQSNQLLSIPEHIITSREQLISLIATWNDLLRSSGMRSGVERFTEFANILFLKLLSEAESDNGLWSNLVAEDENRIVSYINNFVLKELKTKYGNEVIAATKITDGKVLQKIIRELNTLSLSSIDEDIKGLAFEHFIQQTTTQNDLGEYFTPRHIVKFMVQLVDPQLGYTVFDPFCGTGGFLVQAYRYLSSRAGRSPVTANILQRETVFGNEITSNARIAKMNMILFGDGHSGITQTNSITNPPKNTYDIVLSNIPFSQKLPADQIRRVDSNAIDADEACFLRCFHSLKNGGSMAVVIPEGLAVNRKHRDMWTRIFSKSKVRLIASLPRGCFAPYTEAATRIVYLTDKNTENTKWFYYANISNDGYTNQYFKASLNQFDDLQNLLFFYSNTEEPETIPETLKQSLSVLHTDNLENVFAGLTNSLWQAPNNISCVALRDVAIFENGQSITEKDTLPGDTPVIAGGRVSPYTHNTHTHPGNVFTVSKSGAYSGYVWWHSNPIWASDSIVVRSKDETRYLTSYLYACVKHYQYAIYARQQGTGQPHIYQNHIEAIPIPIRSLEQQTKLVQGFLDALRAYEKQKNLLDKAHERLLAEVG